MDSGSKEGLKPPVPTAEHSGLYESSASGFQALVDAFNYWSGLLNERSLQMLFALIAGNWVVHSTADGILSNSYAKSSLVVVFAALALDLLAAFLMSRMHLKQFMHAEQDRSGWEAKFKRTAQTLDPWPFTPGIDRLGRWTRRVRLFAPLLAGALFIISLFCG